MKPGIKSKVQHGEEPDDWKPMKAIGASAQEIKIQDEAGTFRVVYIAKLKGAVYVLHCFQKKTQRTSAQASRWQANGTTNSYEVQNEHATIQERVGRHRRQRQVRHHLRKNKFARVHWQSSQSGW